MKKINFRLKSNVIKINQNPIIKGIKIKLLKIIEYANYSIKNKFIELYNNNLFIWGYNNINKFGFDDSKQIIGDE